MDLVALLIGVLLGLILGLCIAWFWPSSSTKANSSISTHSTEAELKALLGQKAQSHLQTSRESIHILEREIAKINKSISQYENSLTISNDDESRSTFFGEHTSLFLRNADTSKNEAEMHQTTDSQPKDFANKGSGLFVGSAADSLNVEEKSNN